ncbi:MAG: CDP-diacylglycerol--glycerol-3-phosphate 3-phosphatidyltransferase [Candidatus Latescibacteria bacterium]|nr:CDP-diacylglycerol--glycerol-3-phosphate 3-phosphatidyltransferase [Candidatus Latescibacterota bacterium]
MERSDTLSRNAGGLGLPEGDATDRVITFPNVLTAVRLALTPIFLVLIFAESWYCVILALLVFTVASLTDFYDGRIARREGTVTSLGKFLDPLADKILVSSALIAFVVLGMVEAWLVGAMLLRDAVITGLRILGVRRGKQVVTSRLAKWKTGLQLVLIFGILVFINVNVIKANLTSQPVVLVGSLSYLVLNVLVAAVTLVTVVSGVRYLMDLRR